MQISSPTASFGYYRGNPQFGGYGSGMGTSVAGIGQFAQGQGVTAGDSATSWTPTVMYLFVLVIAEMFVFGFLSRHV